MITKNKSVFPTNYYRDVLDALINIFLCVTDYEGHPFWEASPAAPYL